MTMEDQVQSTEPRSPGITYQQLLDTDNFPVPDVLRLEIAEVPRQRRRAEDAVHVGRVARARGRAPVEEGLAVRLPRGTDPRRRQASCCTRSPDMSFIVTRVGPDEIKAYYNACLHRGRP